MDFTYLRRSAGQVAVMLLGICLAAPVAGQSLAGVARPPAAQSKGTAKGFIWKAERNGQTAWLVGSLHLLTPDFYPLPSSMESISRRKCARLWILSPASGPSPGWELTGK